MLNMTLPSNSTVIKINKNLIITNNVFTMNIICVKDTLFINFSNILVIKNVNNINYNERLWTKIHSFFFLWNFLLINKITFQGKGYKIKKKTNSLNLSLNKYNNETLLKMFILIKRIKKYKFLILFNYNRCNVIEKLLKLRYINIFTKRGLRLSRQVILKKIGKKNSN